MSAKGVVEAELQRLQERGTGLQRTLLAAQEAAARRAAEARGTSPPPAPASANPWATVGTEMQPVPRLALRLQLCVRRQRRRLLRLLHYPVGVAVDFLVFLVL